MVRAFFVAGAALSLLAGCTSVSECACSSQYCTRGFSDGGCGWSPATCASTGGTAVCASDTPGISLSGPVASGDIGHCVQDDAVSPRCP